MKRFNSVLKLCFVAGFLVSPIAADECGTLKSWMTSMGEFFNDDWGFTECKQKTEEFVANGMMDESLLTDPAPEPVAEPESTAPAADADSGAGLPGTSDLLSTSSLSGGTAGSYSFLDSMKEEGWSAPEEKLTPKASGYLTDGKGNVVFVDDKPLSNDPDRYELVFSEETGKVISVNDNHRQMSYVPWIVSTKPEGEVPLVLKTRDYDDYDWSALKEPAAPELSAADLTMPPSTDLPVVSEDETVPDPGEVTEATPEETPEEKKETSPYTDDDPGTLSPTAKKECAEGPIYVGVHSMACIDEYNRAQAEKGKETMSPECGSDFIGPLLPGQCDTPSEEVAEAPEETVETDDSDKLPSPDDVEDESTGETMDILAENTESTDEAVANIMASESEEDWRSLYEPSPGETEETEAAPADEAMAPRFYMPDEPVEAEEGDDEPLSEEDEDWFAELEKEAQNDPENSDVPVNAPDLSVTPEAAEDDADNEAKSTDELDLSAEDVVEDNTPWSEMTDSDAADEEEEFDVFALDDSDYSVESLEKMDSYVRNNITVVSAQSEKDKDTGVHVRSVVAVSEDGGEEVELMGRTFTQGSQKLNDMRNSEIESIAAELGVSRQQIEECKTSMANRDTSGHLEHLTDAEAIRKCLTSHIMLFSDELVITQEQYMD